MIKYAISYPTPPPPLLPPESLHKQRADLDLVTCCVGDLCTIHRNGIPWPVVYGAGVNVRTGEIFPATFTDRGPDLDIRNARTLTGGDSVGVSPGSRGGGGGGGPVSQKERGEKKERLARMSL